MSKKKLKTVCPFKEAGVTYIDYKDVETLKKYLSRYGRITPRYYTGVSLKFQKMLASAIKKARVMALLPYTLGE
ncbi:MAG: 30S ribosomal protein S18 [Candidatus Gracilibacteria bacterium]|jgi:small subunit ribosomal protein S18